MNITESSFQDHEDAAAAKIKSLGFAIITLSDTRTVETDISGAFIKNLLLNSGHTVPVYRVLPDDRVKINPARKRYFGEHRPASTLVGVTALVLPEAKVEIEATAVVP